MDKQERIRWPSPRGAGPAKRSCSINPVDGAAILAEHSRVVLNRASSTTQKPVNAGGLQRRLACHLANRTNINQITNNSVLLYLMLVFLYILLAYSIDL